MTFSETTDAILVFPNCQLETDRLVCFDVHNYVNKAVNYVDSIVENGGNPNKDLRSKMYRKDCFEILSHLKSGEGIFRKDVGKLKFEK